MTTAALEITEAFRVELGDYVEFDWEGEKITGEIVGKDDSADSIVDICVLNESGYGDRESYPLPADHIIQILSYGA